MAREAIAARSRSRAMKRAGVQQVWCGARALRVWLEASRFARPWQWLMAQRDNALLRAEVLMYVAIRRYDGIEPSTVAEFVRRVTADSGASTPAVEQELDRWAAEGGFVPLPRETPGFEAYYLVNAGNGVLVSISLFGGRAAAEESTRGAAEWVSRNLADLIRLPPQVLTGEVVAQRTTEHPPLA